MSSIPCTNSLLGARICQDTTWRATSPIQGSPQKHLAKDRNQSVQFGDGNCRKNQLEKRRREPKEMPELSVLLNPPTSPYGGCGLLFRSRTGFISHEGNIYEHRVPPTTIYMYIYINQLQAKIYPAIEQFAVTVVNP